LALESPLLANENTKLVKKQIDKLLLVIITGEGVTGGDSSLGVLHKVSGLVALHFFCCAQDSRTGVFVREDREDGVEEEERKGFAVKRNAVAIFLDLFLVGKIRGVDSQGSFIQEDKVCWIL